MKTTLVAIIIAGFAAGLADATPARNLNKRRAEKKRDAQKKLEATQAHTPQPAQSQPQTGKPASAATQKPSSSSQATAPGTAATPPAPAATAAPPVPAGPSSLSRAGKPPSRRFFSRLRSDSSRNKAKAAKLAKAQTQPAAEPKKDKKLIYRRTWGPRSHRRPR